MLLHLHGPLSQKILSPRVHSSLECIQASEKSKTQTRSVWYVSNQKWNLTHWKEVWSIVLEFTRRSIAHMLSFVSSIALMLVFWSGIIYNSKRRKRFQAKGTRKAMFTSVVTFLEFFASMSVKLANFYPKAQPLLTADCDWLKRPLMSKTKIMFALHPWVTIYGNHRWEQQLNSSPHNWYCPIFCVVIV